MTQEFIINVLLIVSVYLLTLELGVFIFKKIKNYFSNQFKDFHEVGVMTIRDEDEE